MHFRSHITDFFALQICCRADHTECGKIVWKNFVGDGLGLGDMAGDMACCERVDRGGCAPPQGEWLRPSPCSPLPILSDFIQ